METDISEGGETVGGSLQNESERTGGRLFRRPNLTLSCSTEGRNIQIKNIDYVIQ
jgi:hypothetical protein